MAGKKRRKRRAHRVRSSTTARSKPRQQQAIPPDASRPPSDRKASVARISSANGVEAPRLPSPGRRPASLGLAPAEILLPSHRLSTALLPGRVFFAMGRPVPGVVCCILQASLLGWVPAAIWAVSAKGRLLEKQRGLAARLRPL